MPTHFNIGNPDDANSAVDADAEGIGLNFAPSSCSWTQKEKLPSEGGAVCCLPEGCSAHEGLLNHRTLDVAVGDSLITLMKAERTHSWASALSVTASAMLSSTRFSSALFSRASAFGTISNYASSCYY